jgi:hypothetical protein
VIVPSVSTVVSVHCMPSNFTSIASQSPSMRPANAPLRRRVDANAKRSPTESPFGGRSMPGG